MLKTLLLSLMFLSLMITLSIHNEAQASDKPKSLKSIISELRAEGKSSLESQAWLREKSNHARETKAKYEAKAIFKELSKRLDRNPMIDAYVKLQLLSYLQTSDFNDIKLATLYKIIVTAPPYAAPPKIPSAITSAWSKAETPGASDEDVRQAKEAWEVFINEINARQEFLSSPAAEYRKKLISMIPMKTSLKTYMRLQDLEDVLKAEMDVMRTHGFVEPTRQVRWVTSMYFVGLNRAEDWNPKMEKLFRDKIRDIQQIQPYFIKEPKFVTDKNIWTMGKKPANGGKIPSGLKQLNSHLDEAVKK